MWGSYFGYISCTSMFYISVTHSACMVLPTSNFQRALARARGQDSVSHLCPTLSSPALLLGLGQIWMVGRCISCRLVEMILLTGFTVDVTAAVGAFCCLA